MFIVDQQATLFASQGISLLLLRIESPAHDPFENIRLTEFSDPPISLHLYWMMVAFRMSYVFSWHERKG